MPPANDHAILDPEGRFRLRLRDDRAVLASLASTVPRHRGELQALAHRLAGAAGTFGFAAVGAAAMVLEDALIESGDDLSQSPGHHPDRAGDRSIESAVTSLLTALDDALRGSSASG